MMNTAAHTFVSTGCREDTMDTKALAALSRTKARTSVIAHTLISRSFFLSSALVASTVPGAFIYYATQRPTKPTDTRDDMVMRMRRCDTSRLKTRAYFK